MLETHLYPAILLGAKSEGWILTKIIDGSLGKKPFDMFGIDCNNKPVAIEVKVWRSGKASVIDYPIEKIHFESQQLTYLRLYARRQATSWALIFEEDSEIMYVYDFTKEAYIGALQYNRDMWVGWNGLKNGANTEV